MVTPCPSGLSLSGPEIEALRFREGSLAGDPDLAYGFESVSDTEFSAR